MKDLIAITNAMTDLVYEVSDKELEQFGVKKGSYTSAREIDIQKLEDVLLKNKKVVEIPGGSPANVACGVRSFELETGIIGTVGNDGIGRRYIDDLKKRRIDTFIEWTVGPSGKCYTLISPDGERTFITDLGISSDFSFDFDIMKDYKILHTSAYELVENDHVREAIDYFHNTLKRKVSFDLASAETVRKNKQVIENVLTNVDILFVTGEEEKEIKDIPLKSLCGYIALKKGEKGSIVYHGGIEYKIRCYPVNVVDTNGAGDAYAAGFLTGYLNKYLSTINYGELGSVFAGQVCTKKGARI